VEPELDNSNLDHSPDAVAAWQETAGFFVAEARTSPQIFPEEERDSLIYSADLIYTGANDWIYEQVDAFCPDGEECNAQPSE
jgi:hypothetical protein